MKLNILLIIILLYPLSSGAQIYPFNPSDYEIEFEDDFNYQMRSEWHTLYDTTNIGDQFFSSDSKYLTYGGHGSGQYLNLKAFVENHNGILTNYSAGIFIPAKIWNGTAMVQNPANPFHYGYYEIEARVLRNQPKEHLGLWPAFWFQHSEKNDPIPGKYWYEEVDIFEPNACQVAENKNVVHYWTLLSDNDSMHTSNTWRDPEHVHEITLNSLGNWHKYGVEWLPNRLIFYVDGEPFHTIQKRVPFHDRPQLFIDLQLVPQDWGCSNLKTTAGDYIGTFQINYFKYYKLPSCSGPITEAIGNGYNFNTWINALNTVHEYCIFKNTSIPSSSNIIVRAGDYVELKEDFTVPLGASLEIRPTQCQ